MPRIEQSEIQDSERHAITEQSLDYLRHAPKILSERHLPKAIIDYMNRTDPGTLAIQALLNEEAEELMDKMREQDVEEYGYDTADPAWLPESEEDKEWLDYEESMMYIIADELSFTCRAPVNSDQSEERFFPWILAGHTQGSPDQATRIEYQANLDVPERRSTWFRIAITPNESGDPSISVFDNDDTLLKHKDKFSYTRDELFMKPSGLTVESVTGLTEEQFLTFIAARLNNTIKKVQNWIDGGVDPTKLPEYQEIVESVRNNPN